MTTNFKILDDGRINCRARIVGTYNGDPFIYEDPVGVFSQFINPDGDPSTFWWSDGNFSCDCNRSRFLPERWGVPEDCGDRILIDFIEPIGYAGPVLILAESADGKEPFAFNPHWAAFVNEVINPLMDGTTKHVGVRLNQRGELVVDYLVRTKDD